MPVDRLVAIDSSDVSRRYHLTLSHDAVADAVESRLQRLRRHVRLKGFRPGHVPLAMVRRLHQEEATNAALEQATVRAASEAMKRDGLRPVGRPTIGRVGVAPNGDYEFELYFETLPDISLRPFDGLVVTRLRVADHGRGAPPSAGAHLSLPDISDSSQIDRLCREYEKRQVLDWLADCYDFPVPPTMMANELERILKRHTDRYVLAPDERLQARYADISARRTRLALLLVEIGRVYGIEVPYAEIEKRILSSSLAEDGSHSELLRFYTENPTALAELHSALFEDRVVEFLMQSAQVVVREVEVTDVPDIVTAALRT